MPPVAPQPVQITCPACGTPYRAAVYTLVDVSQQPELKGALLSGQLNVAACPSCRTPIMLGAQMVYHDPAKQLCLIYFPQELNARPDEQERFVGEATSFLMRSLPADAPKGYLLNPRRFLSQQSLIEAVFEADGISREMLEAQRRRVDLISALAGAVADDAEFEALVKENRGDLTPEFFATLNAFIEATPPNQDGSREVLEQTIERLAELLGDISGEEPIDSAELTAAVERLSSVSDDELVNAVAELRPIIEYAFFEAWTAQIETLEADGQSAEAARLTERRGRILDIVNDLDTEAQAMFEAGSELFEEVLSAPDPEAALRERAEHVNEAFMVVLSANAGAAQRAGQDALVARLDALGRLAVQIIQERLSPEERFINELLMAETPQESTKLLRKNVAKITPDLVKQLNELADQENRRGNKDTSERLRQLARECGAMLF